MAQDAHIIDLRRSYIPIDPNAFPATMHTTQSEDQPESRVPVLPYDGYNFMPTPQGYCSFFGINSKLGIDDLPARCDDLFMIQTMEFQNILIALCENGIWIKDGGEAGAWEHAVVLGIPAAGVHRNWSKCVIDNVVYVYRQGQAKIWEASPSNGYVFTPFDPTFLNMAGQLGIFKAGGRLGIWDSENSIGWSAFGDTHDFEPSPETLAGNSIFQDIVGRIVNVLQHGTGFIIYCTKSIVHVTRHTDSAMLWSGRAIFNNNGISYRNECCFAEPDTRHFASSTQGIIEIDANGQPQFVAPEISTYLKEKRDPLYVSVLNGRYLFIPFLDPYYLTGRAKFVTETIDPTVLRWKRASIETKVPTSQCKAMLAAMENHDQIYLNDHYGYSSYAQATNLAEVPVWTDKFASTIPVATLNAWKAYDVIALFGSIDFFLDPPFTQAGIPVIGGGTEFMLPNVGIAPVAGYAMQVHEAPNEGMFYHVQDFIWWAEERFFDHWKEAIYRKNHAPATVNNGTKYTSSVDSILGTQDSIYEFGPYLLPTYFSEANRMYGLNDKSAWLQRSLTRGILIACIASVIEVPEDIVECKWVESTFAITLGSYESVLADGGPLVVAAVEARNVTNGNPTWNPVTIEAVDEVAGAVDVDSRVVRFKYDNAVPGPQNQFAVFEPRHPNTNQVATGAVLPVGLPVFGYIHKQRQEFRIPEFKYVDLPTCTYKELGYTLITAHGHYQLDGNFVVDNTIPEVPDYVDVCDDGPDAGIPPFYNDTPITPPFNGTFCGKPYTVLVDGQPWVYPPVEPLVIPGGTILLQRGSIEPIYPTFLGAWVYDIHYKKWGKLKMNYKQLLDYLPINNVAGDSPIPYDTFNPRVSVLLEDGSIAIFDQFPTDSEIVFGKIGYYRKGFTDLEEVRFTHRALYDGYVFVESSLDGKNIESTLGVIRAYGVKNQVVEGFSLSARWYNVGIRGNYDLTHLEVRGLRTGRR